MANMTFKASLLPSSDFGYSLGSNTQRWNLYGNLTGNADTATKATQDGSGNIITSTYVKKSGDTMTGDLQFKTTTADSPDIVWLYGNTGKEQARIWMGSGGTGKWAPLYRCYNSEGNSLYNGNLVLGDGTGATGTWGISITGNAGTATKLSNTPNNTTTFLRGDNTWSNVLTSNFSAQSIELSYSTPFIDFHYNNSTADYTSRLIAESNGTLTCKNNFRVENGEIQTTNANGIRLVQGNYGVILRNDGGNFWILVTASGSQYGSWRDITGGHPFRIDLATGYTHHNRAYGAVWNDYAEYRKDNTEEKDIQKPGRCVKENGDGTLSLTTKRLERGCEIISDTFGFAIGQDEENGYNTPIASSGRVLAYPYESIEGFASHIGYAVCSGPNGTVSIMTDEEEEKYPMRAIGTISEIPDYEEWGTGKVKVNGRVWIRIR